MISAAFIIAILGCGEGPEPCEQLRLAETRYESRDACLAATDAALVQYGADAPYPVVIAECRAEGGAPARLSGADALLPEPDRRPSAWDD
jgi:hypothetical protein